MRPQPRNRFSARHRSVTRMLVQTLRDAGIDAVDSADFLRGTKFVGGTVEDVAQGRTLVAWDVDYIDPEGFPLKDHQGVLVVRISDGVPMEILFQKIVRLACDLCEQRTPKNIIVLEPVTTSGEGGSFVDQPKVAA